MAYQTGAALRRAKSASFGAIVAFTVALSGSAIAAQAADTQSGTMTGACAQQDLAVIALIEQAKLPSVRLAAMGLAQLDARLACLKGQEADALARYEEILADGGSQTASVR